MGLINVKWWSRQNRIQALRESCCPLQKIYKIIFKLFPPVWSIDVCMKATSNAIVDQGGHAFEDVRLCCDWVSIYLMASCIGWSEANFWSPKPFNGHINSWPFKFTGLMTKHCLDQITSMFWFTNKDAPTFVILSSMYVKWLYLGCKYMAGYISLWILWLDKLMSIWFQRWNPGVGVIS